MNLAVVVGPSLADLGDAPELRSASVRVREPTESAADRRDALRAMLGEGVHTVLVLDDAVPARPDWGRPGLALVADHINLTGDNPLVGVNDDAWGPRFPDLTEAWDPGLRRTLRGVAAASGIETREGVVATVTSDRLTTAELAMLRTLGADMGSAGFADEAIVARHAGRKVAGIAVLAPGPEDPAAAERDRLASLLRSVLPLLAGTGRSP